MWILIITLLHGSDPVVGQFGPAVHSIDFLTKVSCENARKAYLDQFDAMRLKLKQGFKDHAATGEGHYETDYVFGAICVPK